VATLLSVAYIFVQRWEGRKEREQKEQLARMLARVSTEPVLLGADPELSRTHWPISKTRNEQIRAALIRAAAGHQSLGQAFGQVQDFGCDQAELVAATQALADSGLLHFEEPLNLDSILSLKV
jgi:hypothetical protein